jgi:hypothetical protein
MTEQNGFVSLVGLTISGLAVVLSFAVPNAIARFNQPDPTLNRPPEQAQPKHSTTLIHKTIKPTVHH